MTLALWSLAAFLLGSVPFALLLVRAAKGLDLRTLGSGNVGATNASRAFATRRGRLLAFSAVYLLDAGKGFLPAFSGAHWLGADPARGGALLGLAAILGHVFCPFLGFRGGKGVATATGVLLALDWPVALGAIAVFFVVRKLSGEVFWGSLALGAALPGFAMLLHRDDAFAARLPVTALCLLLAVFLVFTHRSNLRKRFARPATEARP
jgi:glycerol-3-phosphate acyltransferase PlsY